MLAFRCIVGLIFFFFFAKNNVKCLIEIKNNDIKNGYDKLVILLMKA